MVDDILYFAVSMYKAKYGPRAILHFESKPTDLAEKLVHFGLNEISFPAVLGGSWAYENWIAFLRQQDRDEQAQQGDVSGRNGGRYRAHVLPTSEAERKDHKRKLNAVYSRQKRERQQAQVDRVKELCIAMETTNNALEADNERLELLIDQAADVLKHHQGTIFE